MSALATLINASDYAIRSRSYSRTWGATLRVVEADGQALDADDGFLLPDDAPTRAHCSQLIHEALRWGEGAIDEAAPDHLLWAQPVLCNQQLVGGVVASLPEAVVFPAGAGTPALDLRQALAELRRLLEDLNLINAALLAEHRERYRREQERAYTLHDLKTTTAGGMAVAYLEAEPRLLSAMSRDDRQAATEIINRLLVIAYHRGAGHLEVLKSHLLELVISMVRSAVGAGGSANDLLGVNYRALQELGGIHEEEALAAWLVAILHRIMDALAGGTVDDAAVQIQAGITFMQQRYGDPIKRDDAARAACLSPSYFSRQLKALTGQGFTEHLNRIRIDHAAVLLRRTDLAIIQVALESGFADQSYFTKVFRQQLGRTPRAYRKDHRSDERAINPRR